jgi:hypothetical protein
VGSTSLSLPGKHLAFFFLLGLRSFVALRLMFLIVALAFVARDLKLDLDLVDVLPCFWGGMVHKGKVGSEVLAIK